MNPGEQIQCIPTCVMYVKQVPDNALLNEDGTPLLSEDGQYLLAEDEN